MAPAAKKKRAATKAWTKAQKVTVIQPLALAIKKQETTRESSNEQIRRSKREDNQIQRDLDYQQNVICRDRRCKFRFNYTFYKLTKPFSLFRSKSNCAFSTIEWNTKAQVSVWPAACGWNEWQSVWKPSWKWVLLKFETHGSSRVHKARRLFRDRLVHVLRFYHEFMINIS